MGTETTSGLRSASVVA